MVLTERNLAESRASHTDSHDVNGGKGNGKGSARSQSIIPIPREATSVATMMGLLPVLNSFRTQSRSFCCLSPWIASDLLVEYKIWMRQEAYTAQANRLAAKT